MGALLVGAVTVAAGACTAPVATLAPPSTPLPLQAGCAAKEPAPLCILILGDSIAAGAPLEGEARWWRQLEAQLAAALPRRTVVVDSWAVSGSQVDLLESAARDQPGLGSYDFAIVIEGVNDEVVLPTDAWRARYEAAVSAIEAKGPAVMVATPPPNLDNGRLGTRYDAVAQAIRSVASGQRPLLDIAARWTTDGSTTASTYYVDAIHQSAAGQSAMAALARDAVLEALGRA